MEDVKTVPMENMNTSAKVQSVNSAAVPAMEEDVKTALARNIVMGMAVINADGAAAGATAEDVKTAPQEITNINYYAFRDCARETPNALALG